MWKGITYFLVNVTAVVYLVIVFDLGMDYVMPFFEDFDHYFIVFVLMSAGSLALTNAYLLKHNIYEKLTAKRED